MKNLFAALILVSVCLGGDPESVHGQNIPPLIGDQVGKPKITIPNPLNKQGQQKGGSNPSYSPSAQDTEIQSFLDTFVKSLAERDLAGIGACYSQQPELIVYWNSRELRGWELVQAHWQKVLGEIGAVKLTLNDPDIHVFGRFAWVTARYHREDMQGGKTCGEDGHVTFVLEKKRTQWLILHEHVSQAPGS
jgi:ketosteroid isomerase-like protein